MDQPLHEFSIGKLRTTTAVRRSIVIALFFTVSTIVVCLTIQLRQPEHVKTIDSTTEHVILTNRICQTSQCVVASSSILRRMNLEADPCQHFASFTCGGEREHGATDNKNSILWKIGTMLETGSAEDHSRQSYIVSRDLYRSCMNVKALRNRGLTYFQDAIEMIGGWPLLMGSDWNADGSWNWQLTGSNVLITNIVEAFVKVVNSEETDGNHSLLNILQVKFENNEKDINWMKRIADKLGVNLTNNAKQIDELIEFNEKLVKILNSHESPHHPTAIFLSLNDAHQLFPFIDWRLLINRTFDYESPLIGNETIEVMNPDNLFRLQTLINQTPLHVVANFLIWHLAEKMRSLLLIPEGSAQFNPRSIKCAELVLNELANIIEFEFTQRYPPKLTAPNGILTERIRSQFATTFVQTGLFSNQNQRIILKTLDEMQVFGLSRNWLMNESYYEIKLRDLHLEPLEYYANLVKLRLMRKKNSIQPDPNRWLKNRKMFSVTPTSSFLYNTLFLPPGMIPESFYSLGLPTYIYYGAIGSTIASEIAQHFGPEERGFENAGKRGRWWNNNTFEIYKKKRQCFVQKFDDFNQLSNTTKLDHIIMKKYVANHFGIQQAFNAFKKMATENDDEPRMPGLQEYTAEQMFWITTAQRFCTVRNTFSGINVNDGVPSDMGMIEILISNQREFADAFRCKPETSMNPKNKCTIWTDGP